MHTLPAIRNKDVSPTNDELPSFNLVLLYDHELTAKAAHRITERLVARSLPESDIHQDCWSFEELAHLHFRNEASELAKACDLMLLATINGQALPREVSSWIEHWNRTRTQKDAAFLFIQVSAGGRVLAGKFQPLFGLHSGSKVLATACGPSASEQPATWCEPARRPQACFDSRPERWWGINE